jgi:hypothetical protein
MRKSLGQSALAMAVSLSLLVALGVAGMQAFGFGLRTLQLHAAAAAGAQAMAHGLRVGNPSVRPCWEATDGLQRPSVYSETEVCRAVVANLGTLDVRHATFRVSGQNLDSNGRPTLYRVTVSYREPVTSPLLQLFMGETVTSSAEATSTGN